MSSTFKQMVDHILSDLHGYVRDQEQSSHLLSSMTSTTLAVPVASAKRIPGTGRVEIDDELIWVDSVDLVNNALTVPPYGRGFDTTTAATHAQNTRVISNPLLPRSVIKRAINATIQDASGDLFAIGTTTFQKAGVQTTYALPPEAAAILQVTWQMLGPSKEWRPVRKFRFDQEDGTSGKAIAVYDPIVPGRTVQVVYMKYPTTLVNDADDFATATGLPVTSEDVITYGAEARLLSYLDSSRLDTATTDPSQATAVPFGGASNVSKQMYAMFRERLAEERARLFQTFPTAVHYTR